MPQVWGNDSLNYMLVHALNYKAIVPGKVTVHLIKSPYTILMTTTLAELDAIECSFGGYSSYTLPAYSSIAYDSAGRLQITFPSHTWTANGFAPHESAYGYYLKVDDSPYSPTLLLANIIDPPQPFLNSGDTMTLTLVLKDWSENHPV